MPSHVLRVTLACAIGAGALALPHGPSGLPALISQAHAQGTSASRTSIYPYRNGFSSYLIADVDGLAGGVPQGEVKFENTATTPARALGTVELTSEGTGHGTIAAGAAHTCVVTAAKGVKCWGSNDKGQLGNGTTTNSTAAVDVKSGTANLTGVLSLAAGASHTCAVMEDRGVKCWGLNDKGQLGNDTTTNSSTAVDVKIDIGGTKKTLIGAIMLAAGAAHTCALGIDALGSTTAGTPPKYNNLHCWGADGWSQLGKGFPADGTTIGGVVWNNGQTKAVTASKNLPSGRPTDVQRAALQSTTAVAAEYTGLIAGIWSSNDMSCVLTWSRTEYTICWGYNRHTTALPGGTPQGQQITETGNWVSLAVGSHHVCGLSALGAVQCVRRDRDTTFTNNPGGTGTISASLLLDKRQAIPVESTFQLTTFRPLTTQPSYVTALAARDNATCAITADRRVACWNHGLDGKFDAPKVVMESASAPLANVMTVAVGGSHRCAVVSTATSAQVRCWGGANNLGQLGYAAGTGPSTDTASTAVPGVTPVVRARAMMLHTATASTEIKVKATLVSPSHAASDATSTFRPIQ